METRTFILICVVVFLAYAAAAQTRGASEFQITKITKNLISAPQFTYTGAEQYQTNQRDRWLEVEVEFSAASEFTDELTFKYYILFDGKLLTGEVSHTNIAAGTSGAAAVPGAIRFEIHVLNGSAVGGGLIHFAHAGGVSGN